MADATVQQIQQAVVAYAGAYGIDPQIALAQIAKESSFNQWATGLAGERGLGQIMEATWYEYAPPDIDFNYAWDIDYNLTVWGEYMNALLTKYGFDAPGYTKALEAYNGGPGNVDRGTVSAAAQNYAASILAASGATSLPSGAPDQPNGPGAVPTWAWVALAVVLIFTLK
jgi:soluble lytic murein transglycosylase-like protein